MRQKKAPAFTVIVRVATALWRDENGQDLIEYALILALIALAATVSMSGLANSIGNAFGSVGNKISTYSS
jgi:pilus assembly protein Flp/PilA